MLRLLSTELLAYATAALAHKHYTYSGLLGQRNTR